MKSAPRFVPFFILCVLAILIRAWMPALGNNFDIATVFKIAQLPPGSNFYAEVPIWANWGPISYWLFQIFCRLPGGATIEGFHYYVAGLMTLADLISAWVLWKNFSLKTAAVFLVLSPAAIVISGYHCNCEPLLLALAALGYHASASKPAHRFPASTLVWTGASLAVKHVFFFLPLWMMFRPMSWKERARILGITYGVWALFLSPFLFPDPRPVIQNIFLYTSNNGGAFLAKAIVWALQQLGFAGAALALKPLWMPLFLVMLLGTGWLLRRASWRTAFLYYPMALVASASAVALQYFSPPCFSLAALPHTALALWGGVVPFHLYSLWFFAGNHQELHLFGIGSWMQDHFDTVLKLYWSPGVNILQLFLLFILGEKLAKPEPSHE